ncbi:hypothetical protein CDD81_3894 [Ophiocordyceps australis]|uniref:Uncharacterized protein n=1 Tax=Ophiocordyceps australis TaxID=1399860 RepID=A0A2C5XJF9_9HYPO|nr:hypothetical protein CDD81_3894 [Ophiocordyceps australis]
MSPTIMHLHFPSPPRAMQNPSTMTTQRAGSDPPDARDALTSPLNTGPARIAEEQQAEKGSSPEPSISSSPSQTASALPFAIRSRPGAQFTPYHRPIRSETPSSLDQRPGSTPLEQTSSFLLEPTDENAETGIIAIGMALGSPSHSPAQPIAQEDVTTATTMTEWGQRQFMPTVTTTVEALSPQREEALRVNKPRKWGFFTRSRSKRNKEGQTRPEVQEKANPAAAAAASPPPGLLRSFSSAGRSRKAKEKKESTDRTRQLALVTSPIAEAPMANQRQIQTLELSKTNVDKPLQPRSHTRHVLQKPSKFNVDKEKPLVAPPLPPEPLLDIEIPDVSMERYSVMFSHLLDNRSTTSLLARRQATWDKLKALREEETQPKRLGPARASPRPAPTPRMLRVPREGTQGQARAMHRRSNTCPPLLPSPSPSNFEFTQGSAEQAAWQQDQDQDGRVSSPREAPTVSDRPRLISKFHQQPSPKHAKEDAKEDENMTRRLILSKEQGHFQVRTASPPSSQKAASTAPLASGKRRPSAAQSTPRTVASAAHAEPSPPNSPVKTLRSSIGSFLDEDEDLDAVTQAPVQVSVARQISVSRQQRPLLGALQRHALEHGRINETRAVVPRLVDPRKDPASPQALHRKSERVVVERS